MFRRRAGFTLVELLIVVAIIALLAAIATPNFLEMQVRCKVSRTSNDLRAVSIALEAYRVDTNRFPLVPDLDMAPGRRLVPLTTPQAYMTSLPVDPFFKPDTGTPTIGDQDPAYIFSPGNLYAGASEQFTSNPYLHSIYSLAGRGPDATIVFGGYCMAHPDAIRGGAPVRGSYDPTNGTVSLGDILRTGGSRL